MNLGLSDKSIQEIEDIKKQFPNNQSALMMVMRVVEKELGYLDSEKCEIIAKLLDLTPAYVYGCLKFYFHFKREYHGKYRIMICSTLACNLRGSENVLEYLEKKLNIENGNRTADGKFSIEKVECLGACDKAPVMQINEKTYYELTPEKIDTIIDNLE